MPYDTLFFSSPKVEGHLCMEAVLTKRQSKKGLRDSEKVHNFIVRCLIFLLVFTKVNTARYLTLIMLLQTTL